MQKSHCSMGAFNVTQNHTTWGRAHTKANDYIQGEVWAHGGHWRPTRQGFLPTLSDSPGTLRFSLAATLMAISAARPAVRINI